MPDTWNGDKVKKAVEKASIFGVNATMAATVLQARRNHPGWKNRTGLAEGSIRIQTFAKKSLGEIFGVWGSADVDYMIWLELKNGSALRNAADVIYPSLAGRIKKAL